MLNGIVFVLIGVQLLLDAVIDYMPSPGEIKPVQGEDDKGRPAERRASDDEPFAALAFKIMTDPYVGKLTFFRVIATYSASSA